MKIISGNSNLELAQEIAQYTKNSLAETTMTRFSDKEIFVEIGENVRGEDVFLIQSTSFPANDNLMELLVAIDALKRGSAARITAVLPYFGYARQDRKTGPRTPISAKLVANLITVAGADRILTMDLHTPQLPFPPQAEGSRMSFWLNDASSVVPVCVWMLFSGSSLMTILRSPFNTTLDSTSNSAPTRKITTPKKTAVAMR